MCLKVLCLSQTLSLSKGFFSLSLNSSLKFEA